MPTATMPATASTATETRTAYYIPANVLRSAAPFAGKDSSRPILTAACLKVNADGAAELATTDSYRLAVFTSEKMSAPEQPIAFEIAPIAKMLKASHDAVVLDLDAGTATICGKGYQTTQVPDMTDDMLRSYAGIHGEATVQLRIVEGSYPNYEQLIPSDTTERVDHIAAINPGYLADVAKAAEHLVGKVKGSRHIGQSLRMEVIASNKPVLFTAGNHEASMRAIVMPIRLG